MRVVLALLCLTLSACPSNGTTEPDCAHANTFCAPYRAVFATGSGPIGNGLSGTLLDLSDGAWTTDPPTVSSSAQITTSSPFGASTVEVTPTCGVVDAGC